MNVTTNQNVIIRQIQIQMNKPLKELNHMLMLNDEQSTPKRSTSHTRPTNNCIQRQAKKENQPLISNATRRQQGHSASKKMHNATKGSLNNKPRPKDRKTMGAASSFWPCQNHENQFGCFTIQIEGQRLYYCQKCSKKLKTQGFPVKKQHQSFMCSFNIQNEETCTSFSHLRGHPQFEELMTLLSQIYNSQKTIQTNESNKIQIQQLFNLKILETQQFFQRMEQLIHDSRQQGIGLLLKLKNEWIENNQQQNQNEWKQALQQMKLDIEGNIEEIVGEVDEQTFNLCVENYRQTLSLIVSKTQQLNCTAEAMRLNVHKTYDETINIFEDEITIIQKEAYQKGELTVVTSQCDTNYDSSQTTLMNGPFRNLFNCGKAKGRKTLIGRK